MKNLHYKTIIFPNIGYPIFRDTVIYKKLSCYSSGEVERQVIPLLDLKDTYFTVEDIKSKYDRDYRNRNNKIIEQEEISHYEKFEAEEKEKLKKAIDIVHELLKNTITDFE